MSVIYSRALATYQENSSAYLLTGQPEMKLLVNNRWEALICRIVIPVQGSGKDYNDITTICYKSLQTLAERAQL